LDKLETSLKLDGAAAPAQAKIDAKTLVKANFHVVTSASEKAKNRAVALKAKFNTLDHLRACSPEAKAGLRKNRHQDFEDGC
jgi:hypothetical protein